MHMRIKIALLTAIVAVAAFGGIALATPGTQHEHRELAAVRAATARFHDVDAAIAAGYELGYLRNNGVRIITGCVSHPSLGAMGFHFFNKALVDDLDVDPMQPEALVYAPGPDGSSSWRPSSGSSRVRSGPTRRARPAHRACSACRCASWFLPSASTRTMRGSGSTTLPG